MKHFLYLSFALMLLLSACVVEKSNLKGKLTEIQTDTILVESMVPGKKESIIIDTIILDQGKFATNIPDSSMRFVYIIEKPTNNQIPMHAIRMTNQPIIFLPGNKLILNGTLENYTISGSSFYDEYNKINKQLALFEEKIMELDTKFRTIYQNGGGMDSIRQLYQQYVVPYQDSIIKYKEEYIRSNPNKLLAGYYFTQLPIQSVGTFYDLLGNDVKKGVFSEMITSTYKSYENFIAKEKAKQLILPGKPAPDFTLTDIQNKPFTLSSLKGKYVVLDFWGTWCGWCIKGFPEMKIYYDKYKSKIEFVGIDCGDSLEQWKKGVAELKLPWINVYNGMDTKLTNSYAIEGYPTKVIIDPEGMIVKVVVGESPEFYETLDELMKTAKNKPTKK